MKRTDGHEWFRTSLEFDIEAPDEIAAKERVVGLSRELVKRFGLYDEPVVKIEPAAREAVGA